MLAGFLIWTSLAQSSNIEEILGPEPASDRRTSTLEVRKVEEEIRSPGIQIEILPRIRMNNFKLLGDGLTANLPTIPSVGGQASLSGIFWRGGIDVGIATYSGLPSSLSPNQITAMTWGSYFVYRVAVVDQYEFFAGYQILGRNAQATSPQPLITSWIAHGPHFRVSSSWKINSWTVAGEFGICVPWYFQEQDSVSGSFRFGLQGRLQAIARRPILSRMFVGVGLELFTQILSFSGVGSRGTLNATELQLGVSIPVQIQYEF
jgi:hypothetical protein